MTCVVQLSKKANRQLQKVPKQVARKFMMWVDSVETLGLRKVRQIPGYHDEPLGFQRKGQRSVRLSKNYRVFYVLKSQSRLEVVFVEEVNKHEY